MVDVLAQKQDRVTPVYWVGVGNTVRIDMSPILAEYRVVMRTCAKLCV